MINKADFNSNIKPCDDFNQYVNGNWLKQNPIPDKYTKWGTFEIIHEENLQKLNKIITEKDDNYQILKTIYDATTNMDKLDSNYTSPIIEYIENIQNCQTKDELWNMLGLLNRYGFCHLFGFYAEEDAKNSELVVAGLGSSGLGLPDRDYYFMEEKEDTRNRYKQYLQNIWNLYNNDKGKEIYSTRQSNKTTLGDRYTLLLEDIYNFEKSLAEVTYTRVQRRDPELQYNKMNIEELCKISSFNWNKYLMTQVYGDSMDIFLRSRSPPWKNKSIPSTMEKDIPYILVDNPNFFTKLHNLWEESSLELLKQILQIKFISSAGSYLGNDFYNEKFDFYKRHLSGQKEPKPLWERGIMMVDSCVGELLGKKYQENYFTSEAKQKMLDMIDNLQIILKERIQNLSWMGEETKKKALLKHAAFRAKVGYPDKWRDYSDLINSISNDDSLFSIVIKCNIFQHKFEINRLFKPTDKDRWEMNAHTINAYFHPLKNEIVFPAGILQAPFFDINADDALNYGAIGTVIGHEMTHSYDDMGSKFDEKGNLNDWWTQEDKNKFEEKAKYFDDEYSSYKVNNVNVNGKLTLGENLADHGGVKISYYAFKKLLNTKQKNSEKDINGFNAFQRFFLSWAIVWRTNITPEEANKRIMTDPHSPNEWRINGTLANIPEFYEAFNVKEGDNMYRNNPVQIW